MVMHSRFEVLVEATIGDRVSSLKFLSESW